MRLARLFSFLFLIMGFYAYSQDSLKAKTYILRHIIPGHDAFNRIFGSVCKDSLIHPTNHKKKYRIENINYEIYITAYKNKRKKWSFKVEDLINPGDNYVFIECLDFYTLKEKLVVRLYLNHSIEIKSKEINYIDINQKNGKLIDKELLKK